MLNSAADDKQIGGSHYKKLDPEPWNVIVQWNLGYLEGTALKYIARWRDKGGIEDIKKAIHFLEKLVEIHTSKSNRLATVERDTAKEEFLRSTERSNHLAMVAQSYGDPNLTDVGNWHELNQAFRMMHNANEE